MTTYQTLMRPLGEDALGRKLHSGFPPKQVDACGSADACNGADTCLS